MTIMLTATNAAITALNAATAANTAELAAIQALAKAAGTSTTGAGLTKRYADLQAAEINALLAELRCLAMLQDLDTQNALDRTAGGYSGADPQSYYNAAAVARVAALESALDALFA